MIKILQPRLFVASIYDLDLTRLKARGITGIIMDLDNTLVGWNQPDAPEALSSWLLALRRQGFVTCIVSNNLGERVKQFSSQVGMMSIARAAKPRRRAFRQAMRKMGTRAANTAVIGDQVFTDILGGNRLRLYTILVHPIDRREFWTTRMIRQLEHALVRRPALVMKKFRPLDGH
ncbi:MAG: YqeG family HAD IIIA-type phosphatase [Thermaerobacter sp.]|nr:YqeG family HAD IIIA-type phosphatase [Thermaerobacter sp.]